MPTVNLITSSAPLLSGSLEECRTPDDETCHGGVAAVLALARNHTLNSLKEPEPYTVIQWFDMNSPFVNMHPLQWVVNRLVLREVFSLDVFISTPSLLLQNKVDSAVSQRDIGDMQTHDMSFLLTNANVPSSNSWHEYLVSSYFDPATGLAVANLADHSVPVSITAEEAARGFLNYVYKVNQDNGCYNQNSIYNEYLSNNPLLEFGDLSINQTLADLQDEEKQNTGKIELCWATVILFSDLEALYWPFLETVVQLEHPPDLLVNLEYTYETFPVPELYQGTTWVASCGMNSDNYCQQRIQLTEGGENRERQPRIQNVDFVGKELETLPEELKDEQWRQHILQLRPLADAAEQNNPIVGYTKTMPISRIDNYRACKAGECPLGNLFTDAIRWFTNTDVAFTSSGGYRGEGWPEGPVRLTDLYASLPFPNTECTGIMSGLSLLTLLNYTTSVSTFEGEDTSEGGRLLQVSGMKVTYNLQLPGTKLVAVDVWDTATQAYVPVDRLKMYSFSSDSYVCGAYDPYPNLTGGDFVMAVEVPGIIGDTLIQNIVADFLGSLDEPWETASDGRLVNNTAVVTPIDLQFADGSCPTNYAWNAQTQSCFECLALKNVAFSDESLSFQANSDDEIVDGGRILLVNREATNITVQFKSKPHWLQFTSMSTDDVEINKTNQSPIALASGDRLILEFFLQTTELGRGVDRSALGTVSFGVTSWGGFQGCPGMDVTFDVDLRVTPPDDYNFLGDFFYVGVTLAAAVFLTSLFFTAFVYTHRKARVIRVMQPMFLLTICIGVAILGTAMIPMGIDDGLVSERGADIACMSTPWLLSIGFSLAFSALFSKLWRINKLFNRSAGIQRIVVRSRDVLKPFALLFTLNLGLLTAWTATDPPQWQRFAIDGQDWNTYGKCVYGKAATIFVSLIAAVNFIALVMAFVQAYRARNISDEFSESKYIGVAIYGWLQICLIGGPIPFLIDEDNAAAKYFLQVSLVFVVCVSMVCIIFAPAIVNLQKHETGSHRVRITGIETAASQSGAHGKRRPGLSSVESANVNGNPLSPNVKLGVVDLIHENSKEEIEKHHQRTVTGQVDAAVLELDTANRQELTEHNPVSLQDSSVAENIKAVMKVMEEFSTE